jgi:hypothetical protein
MPNWERAVDRYDLATGRYLGKTQIAEADGSNMYVDDHHNLFPLSGTTMVFSSIGTISNNVLPPHYVFSAIDLVSAQIVHREISKMYPTSGHSNIGSTSVWYDDRGRMNIIEEVNNTAYIINPDCSMSPKATFDLGRAMVNANNFQTIRSAEDVRSKLFFNPFLETHRYLCMQLSYDDNRYVVAFDKSSGKSTLLGRMSRAEYTARRQFLGFRNDIDGGFALQAANIYSSYDENTSFASYDAYKMIELLTPEHFAKVRSTVKDPAALARLRNFVASLKEEDNPVIVIAHLK